MSVADDLIAVRTLLMLRGRSTNAPIDDNSRVCLGQAMQMVSGYYYAVNRDQEAESFIRHKAMYDALVAKMPLDLIEMNVWVEVLDEPAKVWGVIPQFNDWREDQDVFDVIDKALAELGALA